MRLQATHCSFAQRGGPPPVPALGPASHRGPRRRHRQRSAGLQGACAWRHPDTTSRCLACRLCKAGRESGPPSQARSCAGRHCIRWSRKPWAEAGRTRPQAASHKPSLSGMKTVRSGHGAREPLPAVPARQNRSISRPEGILGSSGGQPLLAPATSLGQLFSHLPDQQRKLPDCQTRGLLRRRHQMDVAQHIGVDDPCRAQTALFQLL